MTTWQDWAIATLAGIKAPATPTNLATLRGWSTHEKGWWPSIQWCNPLNTTQPWAGAVDSGAQPGPHDVKIYGSLADGVGATVNTLLNGYYGAIVAALRQSRPTLWWEGGARTQLDTWGTGQSWLNTVPLTEDVLATIDEVFKVLGGDANANYLGWSRGVTTKLDNLKLEVDEVKTQVIKPEPAEVEPTPAPAIDPQVAADLATVAGFLRKLGMA